MWRKIYLIDIGLVKKKNQTGVGEGGGRGGGVEDMEVPVVSKI